MHYTGVVIWHSKILYELPSVSLEGERDAWRDVLSHDGDVIISVRPVLLMMHPYCVTKLVHYDSFLEK